MTAFFILKTYRSIVCFGLLVFFGCNHSLLADTAPVDDGLQALSPATGYEAEPGHVVGTDDRIRLRDWRIGRIVTRVANQDNICTAWRISNGAFLTAGHCNVTATAATYIDFDVPFSNNRGIPQFNPDYKYNVAAIWTSAFTGACQIDWKVLSIGNNLSSGKAFPDNHDGQSYFYLSKNVLADSTLLQISGYGKSSPAPCLNGPGCSPRSNHILLQGAGGVSGYLGTTAYGNADAPEGASGGPWVQNNVAYGIQSGGNEQINCATSFQENDLAQAIHRYPGYVLNMQNHVLSNNIIYVAQQSVTNTAPNGNYFSPYLDIDDGLDAIGQMTGRGIVQIETGKYTATGDITIDLAHNVVLSMLVGDVKIKL